MIQSFGDQGTEDIYDGMNTKHARNTLPVHLHEAAKRKLDMIDAAVILEDLRLLPGNRLEALQGKMRGKYSIRINNQWRVVFSWNHLGAEDVIIKDYH